MNRYRFESELHKNIDLPDKERRKITKKSLEKDPWKTKCTITIEELAELQQQISKRIRGYKDDLGLLEELADVYICLDFIRDIFCINNDDLQRAIDVKLLREKERLIKDETRKSFSHRKR